MCVHPISIKRKYGNSIRIDVVPCGKCAECIKKKQSAYLIRCIEEARKRGRVCFVTLTYNDDSLPYVDGVPSLRRLDIHKMFRDVRKEYKRLFYVSFPGFSYLFCGEYGPRTKRPHYHGLVIGLDDFHLHFLQDYWEKHFGFTCFKNVPLLSDGHNDLFCASKYVSKYCVKLDSFKQFSDVVEKPRVVCSKGFGMFDDFEKRVSYILDGDLDVSKYRSAGDIDKINSRLKYEYNGFHYSLPIYYRKKFFYEKGINGNLRASRLSRLCSSSLSRKFIDNFNEQLRDVETEEDYGKAIKKVHEIISREEDAFHGRDCFVREDLLSFYKKSIF